MGLFYLFMVVATLCMFAFLEGKYGMFQSSFEFDRVPITVAKIVASGFWWFTLPALMLWFIYTKIVELASND